MGRVPVSVDRGLIDPAHSLGNGASAKECRKYMHMLCR